MTLILVCVWFMLCEVMLSRLMRCCRERAGYLVMLEDQFYDLYM